ncbi:Mo-dependent nitrogenase C-terminal domain-containing protein [Leptolyngbya sp. FACHB-17]|uniref:Mo-dependent nitrogenase C-terminal domain-containing protein n=1 Tax=unclassified Leptolyngbya TaxID=2650499 RepID=UPI00167FE6CE|nr:Mo-dependent nitrogenase C-terminal domain-containing protein [Leptolyngbya sp. FACHB-17]MBD2082331.1 nitrogenase [Leptolyngbya sp. FACHB-17]
MDSSTSVRPTYTDEQISVWLRCLLTLAWADDNFDAAEQELIVSLTDHPLTQEGAARSFPAASDDELRASFGSDADLAENFLRTAVMVSLADGSYTSAEDAILEQFCRTLNCGTEILESLRLTLCDCAQSSETHAPHSNLHPHSDPHLDVLKPVRSWLDRTEIHDPKVARFICKMIPPQCPFERTITLFGHKVIHIPPLCKLNPLYDQLVGIRFRALSYLADECGEDVAPYC